MDLDWQRIQTTLIEYGIVYGTRILGALAILVLTWLASRWARKVLQRTLQRTQLDNAIGGFVGNVVSWAVAAAGLLACMSTFGIETTSLAAILGGAGVGIGLALKGNLANFSSGIMLLIVRPFRSGDWVTISGHEGIIDDIQMFTTRIDTFDGRKIILPNDLVFQAAVINHAHHPLRRIDINVGVSYTTDLRQAEAVLRAALEGVEGREESKDVLVRLEGFRDSSIEFKLAVWSTPDDYYNARHRMVLAVKEAFDAAGIAIPFPQIDVHLDGGPPAERIEAEAITVR